MLRRLDDRVLGRPVPDERSTAARLLSPRPAVWSKRGRIAYGLVVLALFGVMRLLGGSLAADFLFVGLLVLGLLVSFADERRRSREYYRDKS